MSESDFAVDPQANRPLLEEMHRWLGSYLRYPGHGLPERALNLASSEPGWSRLARGAGLGQKSNILYNAEEEATETTQILELPGNDGTDLDACQIQLVLSPPAAIPRSFASLQGERIDTQTGEYGNAAMLTFGDDFGPSPIIWPPLLYVVEWGVGGHKTKVEIDAVNGATVNLTASFVRVYGALALDGMANAPGTSGIYTLAAFVGPGWPKPGSAQRTVFVGAIEAGDTSDVFATPLLAKDVFVTANLPNTVAAGYINFYQDPGATRCVGSFFFNGNQPLPFRVPNGGMYFTITSSLGSTANYAAIFALSV